MTVHATCVAFDNRGVLLRGHSGAGKSDLALRLIESGANLVSDDQVVITARKNRLVASPPSALEGMLEVRGVGICQYPFQAESDLCFVVDLDQKTLPERLPDLCRQKTMILGVNIPLFLLDPFQTSAPDKVRAMLKMIDH